MRNRINKRKLIDKIKNFRWVIGFILIVLLNSCLSKHDAFGTEIFARNCSSSDVQAVIDSAGDGDVVVVPAGSCSWTTPIQLCKSIYLRGAGIDNTNITSNVGKGSGRNAIFINRCNGKHIEISGFTFTPQSQDGFGIINFNSGLGTTFRIFDCKFNPGARAVSTRGPFYGVIDNCVFNGAGLLISEQTDPNAAWQNSMGWGSVFAVYIEDNIMTYWDETDLDCESGGKVIYRHNQITGSAVGNHGFDSVKRGCLQMDVSDNVIKQAGSYDFAGVQFRGGAGVVYNNVISGQFSGGAMILQNYRSASGWVPDTYGYGWCNGENSLDGNAAPVETNRGWPCRDQVGRGINQESYPIYEWNNCKVAGCSDSDPNDIDFTIIGRGFIRDHIKQGRDYYTNTQKPGYVELTYPHPYRGNWPRSPRGLRLLNQ